MRGKSKAGKFFFYLINGILGIAMGASFALLSPVMQNIKDKTLGQYALGILGVMALMYLAFFIQIIIHEAGHLVFGLLSGYRFSSFRILSFMLKKENGKLVFKRLSVSGTGGQCLMIPPEPVDGMIPYRLYNFGGAIMNLISAALFLLISVPLKKAGLGYSYLIQLAIVGIYMAVTNGVPMKTTVPNDGYNALYLGRDPNAVRAFWTQLKINQASGDGMRFRDMPDEWFKLPEDADLNNQLVSYTVIARENRHMDRKEFEEAKEDLDLLLRGEVQVSPLYTALLENDRVFLDLLEKGKDADLSPLSVKENAQVLRQMSSYPSVLRTEYAVEALAHGDTAKAEKVLERFEKTAGTFPSAAEIESERDLIREVQEKLTATE